MRLSHSWYAHCSRNSSDEQMRKPIKVTTEFDHVIAAPEKLHRPTYYSYATIFFLIGLPILSELSWPGHVFSHISRGGFYLQKRNIRTPAAFRSYASLYNVRSRELISSHCCVGWCLLLCNISVVTFDGLADEGGNEKLLICPGRIRIARMCAYLACSS
jgi:hypothetical protein